MAKATCLPILKSLPSVVAAILKGNPNFGELPQPKTMHTFSSGWDFMMGLGKLDLHTKFEVASFNRCRNIKG